MTLALRTSAFNHEASGSSSLNYSEICARRVQRIWWLIAQQQDHRAVALTKCCYRRGRMWLPRTSLLLILIGLASSERNNNKDDASSMFIEEAKNLFSQKSIEKMAHAFAHSDGNKQVWQKCTYRQSSSTSIHLYFNPMPLLYDLFDIVFAISSVP